MSGRGKAKPAFQSDFIALGNKAGPGAGKREQQTLGSQISQVGSSSNILSKKVKPATIQPQTVRKPIGSDRSAAWETIAEEVNTQDLVMLIEEAYEMDDMDRVDSLLAGAVKTLRKERAKPDQLTWLSLMYLAKISPAMFVTSDVAKEALCSLLKRDMRESYKSKGNSLVSVAAANILMAAFQEEKHWPELFVRVYMDDAIGERLWVDHPECKLFVDNILTAFNTVLPPQARGGGEGGGPGACPSPPTGSSSGSRTPTRPDDDIQIIELPINKEPVSEGSTGVTPRFTHQLDFIESTVVNTMRDQLNRRQGTDNITRNFIRFLTFACGLPELRHHVVSKLEMWLINPKISRNAQDLLQAVTLNCTTHTPIDIEIMSALSKLRLKTKQNINLFLTCLRDLCVAHPDNLPTMLKQTIFNELSNARNTNNMPMLGVMFQADPEKAAASLAGVFLELLLQKDCYLRALRVLLREIVRCLRHDLNIPHFCLNLMMDRMRDKFENFREFEYKERMFTSLVDLICQSIFLGISPGVKEGLSAFARGERKDLTAYKAYLQSVSTIIKNATWWMHEVVPKLYKPETQVYSAMLYKLMFMAPNHEEYFRIDGWPQEGDRGIFFKLTSEVPVHEDTILRIFLIGLHKSLPLNGQDCLTIAETMIKRAAGLHALASKDFPILYSDKAKQFMECVWELTAYTYPESITLPPDYQPPSMAITGSYWRAWQLLLIMTAHNPEEFGSLGWESYPTLRAMMEMCITSQFVFPPPTLASNAEKLEEMRATELQVAQIEKQQILEFESQLAAASSKQIITEQSSLLLSTIITMNPLGPLRRPPPPVLEQLKQMNSHYKLGHLLCRSRQPDFLLDILQRQGTNQAMPWLADLVESNEGSFSVLPVQCLCEFLLNDSLSATTRDEEGLPVGGNSKAKKQRKAGELLVHLQQLLQNPNSDPASCLETLDYFLRRLASLQSPARLQALAGLKLLLTPEPGEEDRDMSDEDSGWLLCQLPSLPCFQLVYPSLATALRQACQVESDPHTVSLYIRFLSQTCPSGSLADLAELVLDMASVIVERSSLLPAILPGSTHIAATKPSVQQETYQALLHVFNRYMLLVRQQDSELGWSESQDLINVLWSTRESATLHILVVHAQIILLTYGSAHSNSELFNNLLLMWFPPGQELPRAYLVDTSEEALLIPDWLKLKMIRSSVSVLVDSALRDLEPQQLVLFIQSFGIPVESMSKLLQTLDQAVTADLESVAESVLDKNYMGQLVAVQHKRGANGGLVFAKALGLSLDLGDPGRGTEDGRSRLPSLTIPPRSTAMIPASQVKSTILHLFDVGSPSRMSYKEKQDTFRTLQKFLTQEVSSSGSSKPMLEATVSAIHSIIQSDLGSGFASSLSQRSSFSCSLFRLLSLALSKPPFSSSHSARTLATLTKALLRQFDESQTKSPLRGLLQQFLDRMETNNTLDSAKKETSDSAGGLSLESKSLERDIRREAVAALKKENTTPLVESMSKLLIQDQNKDGPHLSQYGLLVDWLELLDPTVISACPDVQAQLVFARQHRRKGEKRREMTGRPYLLSLLTHQASWSVLRETVASVLSEERGGMEPTAVLDFLTACIHIPRLWQGRDQRPPKHEQLVDVLDLRQPGLEALADYVLVESLQTGGQASIQLRVPLVLRCISQGHKSAFFLDYLIQQGLSQDKDRANMATTLLLQVYMKVPGYLEGRFSPRLGEVHSQKADSVVDCVSHTLLAALAATQPGRQWGLKMQELELCARKLVATHPDLFLRNLALLASSLQGRTQYEFPMFRFRNHLTLFSIAMGLLELARPMIFGACYAESLESALTCYSDMCSAYFNRRDSFYGAIDRFVEFLLSWQGAGGGAANRVAAFLNKHSAILLRLASAPGTNKMASLKTLMSCVSLHAQALTEVRQPEDKVTEGPVVRSGSQVRVESQLVHGSTSAMDMDTARLLSALPTAENAEELSALLQDLAAASQAKPEMLTHFQDELIYNISHPAGSVRMAAYSCLLRLLRHAPSRWPAILPGYIAALEVAEDGVGETALQNLCDMTILCQERAADILTNVFRLGLYANMNITQPLTETMAILNMQIGN